MSNARETFCGRELLDGAIWWVLDRSGSLTIGRYVADVPDDDGAWWDVLAETDPMPASKITPVQPCVAPMRNAEDEARARYDKART